MRHILEAIMALAAIFALGAIGAFGVEAFLLARDARVIAQDVKGRKLVEHADGAVTDLGRTIQLAGGVLNETRQIERDNREDLAAANSQTLAALQHVDALVVSFDASQKQAANAIAQTSAALVPVIMQANLDLRELR
jgi:hypothetical protein